MDTLQTNSVESEAEIAKQLDVLIPPPLRPLRKLATSVVLLALAAAFTYSNVEGLIYPRPFADSSWSTGIHLVADPEQGMVAAFVGVPNGSGRDVRLTGIVFDAPGAELIDVVFVDSVGDPPTSGTALPATIEGGDRDGGVWIWFKPTSCVDPGEGWGFAEATFDFGARAFPPLSRTHRISSDPVRKYSDGSTSIRVLGTNEFIQGSGPLAIACEVLQ